MKDRPNTETDSNKNYPATIMFVAIILFQTIIPTIIRGLSLPQYYILFFSAGLVILFCFEYYKKYTNILLFSILAFLLTSIFPLFHFLAYKHNNNSYFFEKYYLDYNVEQSKNSAAKYNDIPYLNYFLKNSSDSILSLDPTKLSLENQVSTDSIIIISSSVRREDPRHPGDNEAAISLYTKKFYLINFIRVRG